MPSIIFFYLSVLFALLYATAVEGIDSEICPDCGKAIQIETEEWYVPSWKVTGLALGAIAAVMATLIALKVNGYLKDSPHKGLSKSNDKFAPLMHHDEDGDNSSIKGLVGDREYTTEEEFRNALKDHYNSDPARFSKALKVASDNVQKQYVSYLVESRDYLDNTMGSDLVAKTLEAEENERRLKRSESLREMKRVPMMLQSTITDFNDREYHAETLVGEYRDQQSNLHAYKQWLMREQETQQYPELKGCRLKQYRHAWMVGLDPMHSLAPDSLKTMTDYKVMKVQQIRADNFDKHLTSAINEIDALNSTLSMAYTRADEAIQMRLAMA